MRDVAGMAVRIGRILAAACLLSLVLLGAAMAVPDLVARHVVPLFLYVPGRLSPDASDPASHGLPDGRETWIRAEDDVRLHAWWIPARGRRCGSVLFFHGNAGTIADRAFLADRFAATGFDVLLPDYRGYGRSAGAPGEEGLYADGEAAYLHARRELGVRPGELAVFGHSLGAAVAAHVAAAHEVAAVGLTGAFRTLPALARARHGWLPDRTFRGWGTNVFDVQSRVRRLSAPVFVSRGGLDAIIPRAQTRSLFEAAPGPRRWYEAPAAGHNDLWADEGFWAEIGEFLSETLECGAARPTDGDLEDGRGG